MAYTINNTAGATLASLQAGTTTTVGGITLIGKNYTGYGEIIAEDFVRLLENQANSSQPSGALQGQLWYDTAENMLKVYNSANWDRLGTTVGTSAPSGLTSGTTWLDTTNSILNVYDGTNWMSVSVANRNILTGTSATKTKSVQLESAGSWSGESADRVNGYNAGDTISVTAIIGTDQAGNEETIAVVSPASFNMRSNAQATLSYESIANDIYGNFSSTSANAGANSLVAGMNIRDTFLTDAEEASATSIRDYANSAISYNSDAIMILTKTTAQTHQGDLKPSANNTINLGATNARYNNIYGVSTSAKYADIAERFESDEALEPGTVIALGGEKEITKTAMRADETVFGVISEHPAFRMNDGGEDASTHPFVAFSGRVPCKVKGPVAKGDRLVSSDIPGVAVRANSTDDWKATFGRALVDKTSKEVEKITIAIGVK
tara:strand:- start:1656 stop:2963 length:1308 start_codon:yes stop_codon:yes gene_type:complete